MILPFLIFGGFLGFFAGRAVARTDWKEIDRMIVRLLSMRAFWVCLGLSIVGQGALALFMEGVR